MSAPLLIAQISDLHIKRPGALAYGQVDTAAALTRCVAALNRFRPRPELVVISGDLADTPEAEEYEHLKRLLAPLEIDFVAVPGNHDSRELMRAALPEGGYAQPSGALNSLHAVGPLDLVLLDFERTRQATRRTRRPNARLARCDARSIVNAAGTDLSAPPTLRHRHPAHGCAEPAQRGGVWRSSAAASTRAPGGRRPRSPRDADAIRWRRGDDLSGAEPCGRPRPRRKLAPFVYARAAGLSPARLVCR